MMEIVKSRGIDKLEQKMELFEGDTLRCHILEQAKQFKTSWLALGQALYTVYKDKLYKEWGFSRFDLYASQEIGVRKETALKLLRSYSFLEKEEPVFLQKESQEQKDASKVPDFEAVDVLRQAKNKRLEYQDYSKLREKVLEHGADAKEVKKDLTAFMKERKELEPEEAKKQERIKLIKRFLTSIKSAKKDIQILKLLPDEVLNQADELIAKIEMAIE